MSDTLAPILEGITLAGNVNTDQDTLLAHAAHSIRLGYPQVKLQAVQTDRVCLVGGGPSLAETEGELRDLYYQGAKLVTVNGAYQWCLERNYRPSAQIVLDARASNARFVDPLVPQCKYLLASQCHPDTWARVTGREHVWIYHCSDGTEGPLKDLLDAYYCRNWHPLPGGTTVVMRAISLLRMMGFVRMDLFGIDSCYQGTAHHAYPQPENDADRRYPFTVSPSWNRSYERTFWCAPWHIKQLEDFLQMIRVNGEHFLLNVHGDGLLAFAMKAGSIEWSQQAADSSVSLQKE